MFGCINKFLKRECSAWIPKDWQCVVIAAECCSKASQGDDMISRSFGRFQSFGQAGLVHFSKRATTPKLVQLRDDIVALLSRYSFHFSLQCREVCIRVRDNRFLPQLQ